MKKSHILLTILYFLIFFINSFSKNLMLQFNYIDRSIFSLGIIIRFLSMTSFILIPLSLLYNNQSAKKALIWLTFPFTIISLCVINTYLHINHLNIWWLIIYISQHILKIGIIIYLIIIEKNKENLVLDKKSILLFIIVTILSTPLNIFNKLAIKKIAFFNYQFGNMWYFIFLLTFILLAILLVKYLKNKDYFFQEKVLFILATTCLLHLCERFSFVRSSSYQDIHDIVGAMPFYVCSFGALLLPFAVYLKNDVIKKLIFLINCPGAIIVFVKPSMDNVSIFSYDVTYFIVNHILLFITSLSLIYLFKTKLDRSILKYLAKALIIYFCVVIIINSIVVSCWYYNPNYSFVSQSPITANFAYYINFKIGKVVIYPLYIIILIGVHFFMSCLTYLVYQFATKTRN